MKPHQQELIARLRRLFAHQADDQVFAQLQVPLPAAVRSRIDRLAASLAPDQFPPIEQIFPLWEEYLTWCEQVEDDWLPAVYLRQYDQGLSGTLFGAPMECNLAGTPGWVSSTTRPLEGQSYPELLDRAARPQLEWVHRLERDLRYVVDRTAGRWGVAVPITIDGFNLALQVRGDQTLLDLYDCPDDLKRFLQAGVKLNIDLVERQRAIIGPGPGGGVADLFNAGWMPGRAVPMSVDCYNFCRAEVYAEFGRPYHQQLLDHFGGGNFHLHGNGRHLLSELAKLRGCVVMSINDDGSAVSALGTLGAIKQLAGPIIPVVGCPTDQFVRQLRARSLPGGVYYTVGPLPSIAAANRLMDEVRRYRA